MRHPDSDINVVALCGCEARVYSDADDTGFRHYLFLRSFSNYGQAKLFADEYEQGQRNSRPVGRR